MNTGMPNSYFTYFTYGKGKEREELKKNRQSDNSSLFFYLATKSNLRNDRGFRKINPISPLLIRPALLETDIEVIIRREAE